MQSNRASAKVTFVVVYHNEENQISSLLHSIEREFTEEVHDQFNFLFLNNCSKDKSSEILDNWLKNQKNIVGKNIGRSTNHMAQARQQALETAVTPWLAYVDADATLKPNWFQRVLRSISEVNEDVVAIGGSSEYQATQGWHFFAKVFSQYFPLGKKQSHFVDIDHVPTNNYLVRKEKALSVGGFDSFFDRVGEDLDINVRLKKIGKIGYDPQFDVWHQLPSSDQQWYRKMAFYGRAQSYVFLKYGGGVPKEKFLPLFMCVVLNLSLMVYPIVSLSLFIPLVLIPRSRFFVLSFLFYGMGELVGAIQYPYLKMNAQKNKTSVMIGPFK